MRLAVLLFGLFAAAIAQALLPAWTSIGLAKPPILLAAVVYYAFTRERERLLAVAVAAGVLQDALGMIPLGFSSAAFCLVGLLVDRFREKVFVFRVVTHFVVGALASGLVTALLALLLAKNGLLELPAAAAARKVVGAMVLGALFVPVVFRLLERLELALGTLEAPA